MSKVSSPRMNSHTHIRKTVRGGGGALTPQRTQTAQPGDPAGRIVMFKSETG